jgi:hypothetical protein
MRGIAPHFGCHAVFDGDKQGAGVGAIMRAGGTDLCGCHAGELSEKTA